MGASVGSFLNVVADRLPAEKSVVTPRSHCQGCGRPIPARDLVPVLSYLWLRGRCRHCRERIPARVIAVEVLAGALFAASYLKFGWGAPFIVACAGVALLMAVAVIDLEHRLIPNRIVIPAVAVLAVLAPFWPELGIDRSLVFEQVHLSSLANSLAAGGGALLVFLAVKAVYPAGMGAGDVKMAGMMGLLVGYPGIVGGPLDGRCCRRSGGSWSPRAGRAQPQGRHALRPLPVRGWYPCPPCRAGDHRLLLRRLRPAHRLTPQFSA